MPRKRDCPDWGVTWTQKVLWNTLAKVTKTGASSYLFSSNIFCYKISVCSGSCHVAPAGLRYILNQTSLKDAMTPRTIAFVKVAVAIVAVVTLVGIPASRLAPGTTLAALAFYIACAFGALVVLTVGSLQLAQFILRKGGTDPQWFWFDGEPPGLVQLREESKAGRLGQQSGMR